MNKNKKILPKVGIAIAVIAICLAVFLLLNNGNSNGELSWQEQYDLGVRYLSEGNYEEAIIAFTAAIEIDPKQPDAYEKLYQIYIEQDDKENAKRILEKGIEATNDENLKRLLTENEQTEVESTNSSLNDDNPYIDSSKDFPNVRTEREDWQDLGRYTISEYDDNDLRVRSLTYETSTDKLLWYYVYEYNERNQQVKSIGYEPDGTVSGYTVYEYEGDLWVSQTRFDSDGTINTHCVYDYVDGTHIKSTIYRYGVLDYVVDFDGTGNIVKTTYYAKDGSIVRVEE